MNEKEKYLAQSKLSLRYNETISEINEQLNQNVIPSLNEIYEDVEHHIQNLENITTFGYNPAKCIANFKEILTSSVVPNITNKAVNEVTDIYEVIISNIHSNGLYNLDVISNEMQSVITDFTLCVTSSEPVYCNLTLNRRMLSKQEELPVLYDKEVEGTTIALVQQVVNYENRVQDYLQEAVASMKPYIALLESCVAIILTKGK